MLCFRFLKQELNFSHFLSMNENGMQIVMYMRLITAMLVMIYKRGNQVRYSTAVRRMGIELEVLIMAVIVIEVKGISEKLNSCILTGFEKNALGDTLKKSD